VTSGAWGTAGEFGWTGPEGQRERVPVVEFDFEAVFRGQDGGPVEQADVAAPRVPLGEVLSPGELRVAFEVAHEILRRASPRARVARRKWRDPVIRQRMLEGMRRGARTAETRRRRSESAVRSWRWRDRRAQRERLVGLWRERRAEFLATRRSPEFRKRMADVIRAKWAEPGFRERVSSSLRSPEIRRRVLASVRLYYLEHPEARERRSEAVRKVWRDPVHRSRRIQGLRAFWAAARVAARAPGAGGGGLRGFVKRWPARPEG
jgi:hypothetical protein